MTKMKDARKSVLITGCSPGGIGHALAKEFNSRGARVLATARTKEVIADLEFLGIETFALDVSDLNSIRTLQLQVSAITGHQLDYLVNNAGRNYTVPALDISLDEARLTFETNVIAVMAMCQVFAPLLISAKGTIVQIGSVSGIMPYVFGSVYNATKAALHQYSNTLRVELAPFDVNVVTIITGGVQSRIARVEYTLPEHSYYRPIAAEHERRVKHSQEGAMPADVYCKAVVDQIWQVRRPQFHTWVGAKVWFVWTLTTFLPRSFQNAIFARMFRLWKLRT